MVGDLETMLLPLHGGKTAGIPKTTIQKSNEKREALRYGTGIYPTARNLGP